MRTSALVAAVIAAPLASLALVVPSADAAVPAALTAGASCQGGGQIRMVSTVQGTGAGHVKVAVRGATSKHWVGEVLPGFDTTGALGSTIGDITSGMKHYVAKHGGFSTSIALTKATSPDAMGIFVAKGMSSTCLIAGVARGGTKVGVVGVAGGVDVKYGAKPAVGGIVLAKKHHRYRVAFAVRTDAGMQRRTVVRTATKNELDVTVRDFKHLPSLSKATVTITDLTAHTAPQTAWVTR